MHVGDVRKAEQDGGGDPADGFAFCGAGKKILQQAAEEEFFGECSEEKNGDREWNERLPFGDVRRVDKEAEFQPKWDGDAREYDERAENMECPTSAPANGIADSFGTPEEKKSGDGDVDSGDDGEDISEVSARIWPEPVRGSELYSHPDSCERREILP